MSYYISYDEFGNPAIRRSGDDATIPPSVTNADFRAFRAWNAVQPVPLDYTTPGPKARRPRTLAAIQADLAGLSVPRQNAIRAEALDTLVAQLAQAGKWADLPGDEPG